MNKKLEKTIIKKDDEYQQENGESNVFCQSYDQLSLKHFLTFDVQFSMDRSSSVLAKKSNKLKSKMQNPIESIWKAAEFEKFGNDFSFGQTSKKLTVETNKCLDVSFTNKSNIINQSILSTEIDKRNGLETLFSDRMFDIFRYTDKELRLFINKHREMNRYMNENVFKLENFMAQKHNLYILFYENPLKEYFHQIIQRPHINEFSSEELITLGRNHLMKIQTIYILIIKFVYMFYKIQIKREILQTKAILILNGSLIINLIDQIIILNIQSWLKQTRLLPISHTTNFKRKYPSELNFYPNKIQKQNTDLQLLPKRTKSIPSSGLKEDIDFDKNMSDRSIYSLYKEEKSELLKEAEDNVNIFKNKYDTSNYVTKMEYLQDQLVPDKLTLKYQEESEITMYERQRDFPWNNNIDSKKLPKSDDCFLPSRYCRPIRVGLSRRQKVKPLHPYLHRSSYNNNLKRL